MKTYANAVANAVIFSSEDAMESLKGAMSHAGI